MQSNLILTDTKNMSHLEWLKFRKNGIGASEISTVLGLNAYDTAISLYYDKIDSKINDKFENMAMFMGKETESFIANLWQYWEGSEDSIISNFRKKNIIRKASKINAYVQNPEYPHLFASLDRRIHKHKDLTTGEERGEGCLEIKNMSGWSVGKWDSGIPPMHLIQVNAQCFIANLDYGELAILQDGRKFNVYFIEKNKDLCDFIKEQTFLFWEKVVLGKSLRTKQYEAILNFNMKLAEECEKEIQYNEPEIDNTDALNDFLSEKYKKGNGLTRLGTEQELNIGREHLKLKLEVQELYKKIKLEENRIKNYVKEYDTIDFKEHGCIHWRNNKNDVRVLRNKINL